MGEEGHASHRVAGWPLSGFCEDGTDSRGVPSPLRATRVNHFSGRCMVGAVSVPGPGDRAGDTGSCVRGRKWVRAEGRSVCASWVPSPLFVASARRASPPGPGGPRCQSIVEYRRLTHGARGQTRGPPVPSSGGCVLPLSPALGSRPHRDVWASLQFGRTLRRSESPSCSSSFQCFICFTENIFQQREQRRA